MDPALAYRGRQPKRGTRHGEALIQFEGHFQVPVTANVGVGSGIADFRAGGGSIDLDDLAGARIKMNTFRPAIDCIGPFEVEEQVTGVFNCGPDVTVISDEVRVVQRHRRVEEGAYPFFFAGEDLC